MAPAGKENKPADEGMTACNEVLCELSRLIEDGECRDWEGPLRCGVDLGTANIVLVVVDEHDRPVAGSSTPSTVVRDGVVVDYIGAVRSVARMKGQLEDALGAKLEVAACAIPPGVAEGSVRALSNVVENAGFRVTAIVDEPSAAAAVLGLRDGAVIDVGGGTTGISVLADGDVVFTADEPTGGGHMTLVLAGMHALGIEQAERLKRDPAQERDVFAVVRPVVEKMACIVGSYLEGRDVKRLYVVGGACCFSRFEQVFEKQLGIPTVKPAAPLLVTPLGIAMKCTT